MVVTVVVVGRFRVVVGGMVLIWLVPVVVVVVVSVGL